MDKWLDFDPDAGLGLCHEKTVDIPHIKPEKLLITKKGKTFKKGGGKYGWVARRN